jgi:endonuclease/exonuclease/phosphatase family metal-dependent hydrolase
MMKNRIVSALTIAMICLVCASGVTSANPDQSHAEKHGIKVMTYNVLNGGTRRGQPLSQTAKVIQAAGADIVGLQEIGGSAEKLAKLLGWKYMRHGSGAIMTRFEIVETYDERTKPQMGSGGARIRLDSGQEVYVFNAHLNAYPYQPYQLLGIGKGTIKTEAEAIAAASKARGLQLKELLEKIDKLPNKDLPVFVTGDFNEPSHLDWTAAAAKSGRHPIKVAYPSSSALAEKGYTDAWRAFRSDEMKHPGHTWTPVTKPDNPKDHHDRIDFVYFKGKHIEVKSMSIVGENKKNADIVVSPYPSDHRAVVATFMLPKQLKLKKTNTDNQDEAAGK